MNSDEFMALSKALESDKREFDDGLQNVLAKPIGVADVNLVHRLGNTFFTAVERFLASCSDSGLTKTQARDVTRTVENVLASGAEYWKVLRGIAELNKVPVEPAPNFLATAQAVLKGHDKLSASRIRHLYKEIGLPVTGFNSKGINLKQETVASWPSLVVGLILLTMSIFLAFYLVVQDGTQYYLTRTLAALGGGLVFSALTKNRLKLNVKYSGMILTAVGSAATFAVLYLMNPAAVPQFERVPQASGASAPAP